MIRRHPVRILPQQWAVLVLCAAIAAIYFPTFQVLDLKWSAASQAYSHGYLIAAICVFLLVRAADPVRQQSPLRPLALLGLISSNAIWLLASLANTMIVQAMIIPVIAFFLLVVVFGGRSAAAWIAPVSYFYFAVPLWDYGNGILQAMTIFVSTSVLDVAGIPAVIDGSFVYLPRGTFEIAEGCAGLHFFIVALALATLYSFLYLKHWLPRMSLVLMAAAGAIIMNWIRVTTIIIAGFLSDMQHYLITVDHYYFGWALFALMLIPLFWIARKFEVYEATNATSDEAVSRPRYSNTGSAREPNSLVIAMTVGIGIAAVFPVINYLIARNEVSFPPPSLDSPLQLDGWIHSEADSATLGIRFDGAQSSLTVRFQDGTDSVMFYANIYGKQTQGAELVSSDNNIYDRSQWRVVSKDQTDFGAAAVSGMFLTLSNRAGNRRILYYWYVVNGESFVDPMIVKMREVLSRFSGISSSGIRVVTRDCSAKCESSRKIVETFVREHGQKLNRLWVPNG